ncbi:hypothetical protein RRG08_001633 [Elysia crispata]|uniref:Uncharacterized protein n=1 Tax=Elysia crispata TaxID=231223 RepID=A0AAE1AKE0_9GAST|nr:hypothetical protein RRG08_001633 [Elysia crispata]
METSVLADVWSCRQHLFLIKTKLVPVWPPHILCSAALKLPTHLMLEMHSLTPQRRIYRLIEAVHSQHTLGGLRGKKNQKDSGTLAAGENGLFDEERKQTGRREVRKPGVDKRWQCAGLELEWFPVYTDLDVNTNLEAARECLDKQSRQGESGSWRYSLKEDLDKEKTPSSDKPCRRIKQP